MRKGGTIIVISSATDLLEGCKYIFQPYEKNIQILTVLRKCVFLFLNM
jgi:hypothetical protein